MKIAQSFHSRFISSITAAVFLSATILPTPLAPPPAQAFTVGEEREVGEKLLSLIRKEFTLLDDPDLGEYLGSLGRQTLALAGPQFFNYHFFIIDNREFNAFTAPSGLIFFHSGLIELCDTEGELVSVLAHEIGHAASRHIADRLERSTRVSAGTTALMLAGLLLGTSGSGGALSQALITGSMAGNAAAGLKFSREDEEEADRLTYKWMVAQDRDPAAIVRMLKKMRRASRYHRKQVPTYLLTHPEPENRIGYIEDIILQDRMRQYPAKDEFAYQRFRYRVLALTKDSRSSLPILEAKTAEPGALAADPMLFYGLSQTLLANYDYVKAEQALRKVMDRFPSQEILKTDLGRIKLESGATAEALAIFQEVERSGSGSLYNSWCLARTLQQTGQAAQALSRYEALAERLPTYSKLYLEIGRLRAALGNQALGHYNLALHHYYEGAMQTARYHLAQALKNLSGTDPLAEKVKELQNKITRLEKI